MSASPSSSSSAAISVTPTTLPPAFTAKDLEKYDAIFFDLDGCVWDHYKFMPFTHKTLTRLEKEFNKKIFFCTNNASAHHGDMLTHLEKNQYPISYPSAENPSAPKQLYTAGNTAATWVKNYFHDQGFTMGTDKILVFGEEAFFREFIDIGFDPQSILNVKTIAGGITDRASMMNLLPDPSVRCVVMGYSKSYNYEMTTVICMYLNELHVPLISSNPDTSFSIPLPNGGYRAMPDIGSFVKQIEAVTGTTAIACCGKPNTLMANQVMSENGLSETHRILMVGDNLLTDIKFGQNAKIDTLLVLSGVTRPALITASAAALLTSPTSPNATSGALPTDLTDPSSLVVNNKPTAVHNLINKAQVLPTYIADNITALVGGL